MITNIKLTNFHVDFKDEDIQEKLMSAISDAIGVKAEVVFTQDDWDEDTCSDALNIAVMPSTYFQKTKIGFGSGELKKEFIFEDFSDLEEVFSHLEASGCYNETGGGWRYIYRNLFTPLCTEYFKEPRYLEQLDEYPHITIEPVNE